MVCSAKRTRRKAIGHPKPPFDAGDGEVEPSKTQGRERGCGRRRSDCCGKNRAGPQLKIFGILSEDHRHDFNGAHHRKEDLRPGGGWLSGVVLREVGSVLRVCDLWRYDTDIVLETPDSTRTPSLRRTSPERAEFLLAHVRKPCVTDV